jgi:hypothetical protein
MLETSYQGTQDIAIFLNTRQLLLPIPVRESRYGFSLNPAQSPCPPFIGGQGLLVQRLTSALALG